MGASRILLKLIDEAILPAFLVLATKIGALLLLVYGLDLSFSVSLSKNLPGLSFTNPSELLLANSYSSLAVLIVVTLGALWVLVKAHYFHDSHISPHLTLRLLTWDLKELIGSSLQIYPQALVWLAFLWLAVLSMVLHSFLGLTYAWLTVVGFVIATFFTGLFILDLEKEVL